MTNAEFRRFCRLYERDLRLLHNDICSRCDARVRNPLAIWHVGTSFRQSPVRVLFVGKPHRGKPGKERASGVLDARECVEELRHKPWAFWSYTIEIARRVFRSCDDDQAWQRIALTNLVKCTNNRGGDSGSGDLTSKQMVRCCVNELGVLREEIALLRPTHVVFYTGSLFPDLVTSLQLHQQVARRRMPRRYRRCGGQRIVWRQQTAQTGWGPMRVLVTSRPERKPKEKYTKLVASWVRRPIQPGRVRPGRQSERG